MIRTKDCETTLQSYFAKRKSFHLEMKGDSILPSSLMISCFLNFCCLSNSVFSSILSKRVGKRFF